MGKRLNRPKRTDPPAGAGGRGHLEIPSIEISSADPPEGGGRGNLVLRPFEIVGGESAADESNWAMHDLPAAESGSVGRGIPGTFARSDAPIRAAQITVGTAKRIIGPAHEVLSGLSIPNDLSEAHRDLFLEFRRTVADLDTVDAPAATIGSGKHEK